VTPAIDCTGVCKSYPRRAKLGIKELLVGKRPRAGRFTRRWALDDVSVAVHRSEALGVIGDNGSGKSTLLAVMLGALRPDAGRVEIHGHIASLLTLGAGFHPDLTGRQNVMLYGSILGMRAREVRRQMHRILDFSELIDVIDDPVRTYSSGMVARLGFSTIINSPADILLVDEILAVGDFQFQGRCLDAMRRFRTGGGTLVIVSHDLKTIDATCDRALWLDEGRTNATGAARDVTSAYAGRAQQATLAGAQG
jgi:lipopolysaccharide transport system ATP-binding protein